MPRKLRAFSFLLFGALALGAKQPPGTAAPPIPAAVQPALRAIRATDLKGDLSFLSSDALAGRYTPSPGLEVAAEFIASRFRSAGLQPAGDQDYFQTAHMIDRRIPPVTSELTYSGSGGQGTVPASSLFLFTTYAALSLEQCPVVVFPTKDPSAVKSADIKGKVVLAPERSLEPVPEEQRAQVYARARAFDEAVEAAGAKLEIDVGRVRRLPREILIDSEDLNYRKTPALVTDSDVLKGWLKEGAAPDVHTISVDIPAPEDKAVTLRNVIGVLPGSDPRLKDTYVLVTAHYDHIGTSETAVGHTPTKAAASADHIYNGANDDGSGTVSVIEIARAFAGLSVHPKRTLVFMTFFGEERGDIGSGYYGRHPVFPLARTIADLNLEQVGRTDENDGPKVNSASLTGFDYSDVTAYLERAGRQTGITIRFDKTASDEYFERSDNAALALKGVPAHTLCVAFDFPDYHGLGDEWPKIDYENMARVDRAVALALWNLANAQQAPRWNSSNPKTAQFRQAQKRISEP